MPGKTPTQSKILNTIINQMAAEKGEQLTVETRRLLRERLVDLIEQNMIAALPEEKLAELEQMTERGINDGELQKLFDEAGVDFVKAAEEAVGIFRKVYMATDMNGDAEMRVGGKGAAFAVGDDTEESEEE